MQINSTTVTPGSNTPNRMPDPNVLAYRQNQAPAESNGEGRAIKLEIATPGFAPSAYGLMVSRLESLVNRNAVDEPSLERLRAHIAQRIGALGEDSRRALAALAEAHGVQAPRAAQVPARLQELLRNPAQAKTALALLKDTAFAALMKDQPRVRTYGPQGLMRAS
ncbi:MAG: hypothetical protein HY423_13870 [Candidatus Lambdaproteobacteria bacterium]|nr:hypothetical protein [Candidatus Lambdaproteobacteria bacterium]